MSEESATDETAGDGGEPDADTAIVLDFLARGNPDADRPQYRRSPVAYAVGEAEFTLWELALTDDADISIADRITVTGDDRDPGIEAARTVGYEDLSGGAESELEYVVEELVEEYEQRFVDFYNEAQPITLRLHQLNLLPGIGKKLRNNILDERERKPFDSFADVADRVSGLHDPKDVIVDRILEELREEDLKYRNFVTGGS
ncbi:MAG: DUF655 domain-containing protein [Halobacteriaceae archaeon]